MQKFSEYIPSKTIRIVIYVMGALFLASLIFVVGISVGSHRPARWDFRDQQDRAFGSFPPPFLSLPHRMIPPEGPGFVGKVTDATLPVITAESRDGDVARIVIASTTIVRGDHTGPINMRGQQTQQAINQGDVIIVIGIPPEDQEASTSPIKATFIRVLPPPPVFDQPTNH